MARNFDGQYRTTPTVSIRGATKSENKDQLLRRIHEDRQQREAQHNETTAAIRVQAVVRGFLARRRHREETKEYRHPSCHLYIYQEEVRQGREVLRYTCRITRTTSRKAPVVEHYTGFPIYEQGPTALPLSHLLDRPVKMRQGRERPRLNHCPRKLLKINTRLTLDNDHP